MKASEEMMRKQQRKLNITIKIIMIGDNIMSLYSEPNNWIITIILRRFLRTINVNPVTNNDIKEV